MNYDMCNTYPSNLDLSLKLTISHGFIGLSDFVNLKRTDKYLNKISEKYIDKYFNIITKCHNTNIIIPRYPSFSDFSIHDANSNLISYNYENTYWYDIFGKKLNRDELVLYYGYFINKACENIRSYSRFGYYSKTWKIIMFSDGFIKSFDYKYDNINDNDIVMNVTLYRANTYYRGKKTKHYWNCEIVFENNKKERIDLSLINTKLLDKLLTNYQYINIVSNKTIK